MKGSKVPKKWHDIEPLIDPVGMFVTGISREIVGTYVGMIFLLVLFSL